MPKVFISHSWEDSDIARKLAEYLKRDGANIWIDYDKIKGGDSLHDRMNEALEWCDTLVLVWSQSAAASRYVKMEWQSALELDKKIIQCMVDDAKRPVLLTRLIYINFQNFDQGYKDLCRSLGLKMVETVTPKPHSAEKNKSETPTVKSSRETAPAKKELFFQPEKPASIIPLFRATPKTLSYADVKSILRQYDFYCKEYDWSKEYSNPNGSGFANQFESKTIQGDKVVLDNASGLMWQQSGSANYMNYEDAKKWTNDLNKIGYAGYSDWRFPTLEEAMSLMEPKQMNDNLYIDPKFDAMQWWIWTSDQPPGVSRAWSVSFSDGGCSWGGFFDNSCVRAVRSGRSSTE
ncbi:MAG: TIR domain-containing protein [bacterium]|nr:TIR domain-containing protein [bacterium]